MRLLRSRRLRGRLVGVVAVLTVPVLVATMVYVTGSAAPGGPAAPEEENPAAPDEWMWLQRANKDGSIPPNAYRDALAQSMKLESETGRVDPQLSFLRWQSQGPANVGGRLIDVVVDPRLPGTVYVAAGTGGV